MIQRKHVQKLILISVSALILALIYAFFNLHDSKKAKEKALLNLPEIPLHDLNGNTFSLNQLEGIKLLVYMDTECTFCAYQTEDLKLVSKGFQNIKIFGISDQPLDILKAYTEQDPFLLTLNPYHS